MALPKEEEISLEQLNAGDVYPGRYEGSEFSADGMRNVKNLDGRVARNPEDVPALVRAVKGQFGRFRVTPKNQAILVRVPVDEDSWSTVYAGRLMEEFTFDTPPSLADFDPGSLAPGDEYPGPAKAVQELQKHGALPVLQDVEREAQARQVELLVIPTAQAIEEMAKGDKETNAILHVTC